MLIHDDEYIEEHINPRHVVSVWMTKSDGECRMLTSDGDTSHIDRDSYDRIVAWMERRDG